MMELFQQYEVEFVSSTEKFDTSPDGPGYAEYLHRVRPTGTGNDTEAGAGRLLFPQPKRLQDRWKAAYGFHTEPVVMEGIHTKKLVMTRRKQRIFG